MKLKVFLTGCSPWVVAEIENYLIFRFNKSELSG